MVTKSCGAVTITYDHHKRELVNKLMDIQHNVQSMIISSQHIHIDHHNCFEIIAVRGKAKDIENLTSLLKSKSELSMLPSICLQQVAIINRVKNYPVEADYPILFEKRAGEIKREQTYTKESIRFWREHLGVAPLAKESNRSIPIPDLRRMRPFLLNPMQVLNPLQ